MNEKKVGKETACLAVVSYAHLPHIVNPGGDIKNT